MNRPSHDVSRQRSPQGITADGLMTFTQLASATKNIVHTVRYYARMGLIEPSLVAANGYRWFNNATLGRLYFMTGDRR